MASKRAYQIAATAAVVAIILLIAMGSVVRTTGSGLGCPDWPLCHGSIVPPWERTAMIEWGHRTLAALVGVLIVGVAVWTVLRARLTRATPVAGVAVVLLVLQAYLGRETVRRELPPELVATHLVTALALTALLVWIAVRAQASPHRGGMGGLTTDSVVLSAISIALVMLAGAYVVANGAGLACTTWPGCAESAVPWAEGGTLQDIQWLHRGAVALAGFAILLQFGMVRRDGLPPRIHHLSLLLAALYATQVLVGASSVWSDLATVTRVLHLTLGSTTWAVAIWLVTAVWTTRDRAALSPSQRQQSAPASP
ncbi:MAG: COX15/CtaA family protein [Dehalococcoidia bacterium]